MSQKFCPYCGAKNEYSYNPPKFCGQCGKALDAFVFAPSSVKAAPVVTRVVVSSENEPETPLLSQELIDGFAAGVKTDAHGMQKVTIKDLADHEEMGVRGARPGPMEMEGIEILEKNKISYACLNPDNFPKRPPLAKPSRARKPRKSSK
jgi:hypothetical protein